MKAIRLIEKERTRQIESEGWTTDHDDSHECGELARAASAYAHPVFMDDEVPIQWTWNYKWWKPTPEDRIKELVKAGALIVAEIERLQRKEKHENDL